jgi:hypothetical protein
VEVDPRSTSDRTSRSIRRRARVLAILLGVLATSGLWVPGCNNALDKDSVLLAEVHVYDYRARSTVIMGIDLTDPSDLAELQRAWESLEPTRRIEHAPGSDYDATLKIEFRDERVVLIAWRQSWSHLQADYLERWESGTNVVPVYAAGQSSARMVEYLKQWITRAGLTPGGT